MEELIIQDLYNPNKTWLIKKYKSGNYYINQKIKSRRIYNKNTRVTKKQLLNIGLIESEERI